MKKAKHTKAEYLKMKTSNVVNFPAKKQTLTLGLPVVSTHGQREGYIVAVRELTNKTCMLIGSGMKPETHEYQIAWCDEQKKPHSLGWHLESGVCQFVQNAVNQNLFTSLTHLEIIYFQTGAAAAAAERRQQQKQADDLKAVEYATFLLDAEEKYNAATEQFGKEPKAIIIAEFVIDQCDSMTDYFGSKTTKTLILGFSKHTRDLFPEMRKAALNAEETKDLFDAPTEAEHREKYSMGGGYYLKHDWRHRTGWKISKCKLYKGVDSIPMGEWRLAGQQVEKTEKKTKFTKLNNSIFAIEEHTHTKKGFQMFIAVPQFEAEREDFLEWREQARVLGGWYSKKWGKTPRGFAFKSLEAAKEFVAMFEGEPNPEGPKETTCNKHKEKNEKSHASKFRDLADKMQKQIEEKLNSNRLTNTPKRQKEAGYARIAGNHLKRTQQALRVLADLHEKGQVPTELKGLSTKKAIHELTQSNLDTSNCEYYDTAIDTNEPYSNSVQAQKLWGLLDEPNQEEKNQEALRREIESLAFRNIPGYFPTQKDTIKNKILPHAQIEKGMRCLEPQAGSGHIADELGEGVDCCEINSTLRDILKKKGHFLIGDNFLSLSPTPIYDRVIMNPPFENGQDIDHVQHAFQFLKPGGRLVAITSQGAFFHSTKKAKAFQEWINNVLEHMEDLRAGEFKESGTNVTSKLIVLTK
jgi:hypothetical protein